MQILSYFVESKKFISIFNFLVFTGPIDAFYASKGLDKLEYR